MARFSGPRFPRDPSTPRSRRPGIGQTALFDASAYSTDAAAPAEDLVPDQIWDYYWPTATSNPERPRTEQARYSKRNRRLEVIFRDGTPWTYEDVHPTTWRHFRSSPSPGKFINRTLNAHPYHRGGWGTGEE